MKFNEKWINLLIAGREDGEKEFTEILENSACESLAIMKYRRLQMNEGRGQHITSQDIKNVFHDDEKVIQLLQELFLEPFRKWHVDYIRKENIDIDTLILRHKKNQNRRLLTLGLTN